MRIKVHFLYGVAGVLALAACSPREEPAETVASSAVAEVSSSETYSLPPADYTSPATILACDWPVAKTDTAQSLLARFKTYAEIAPVLTYEGDTRDGVVIFGSDPRRRVEVLFKDDGMTQVDRVTVRDDSQWSGIQGLHVGSPIADVEAANKKPFEFNEFGWELSGYVADYHGGKLGRHGGKCAYNLRFGPGEGGGSIPDSQSDVRTLWSNAEDVRRAMPVVSEIWVSWPEPVQTPDNE